MDKKENSKIKGKTSNILSKYMAIIVPVVLLLLLITAIAVFNYYASIRQSRITTDINLAARQAELSQEIAKDVMALHLLVVTPQDEYSENSLEESLGVVSGRLKKSLALFDQTLNAFISGGEATSVAGNPVTITRVKIPAAEYGLENSQRMWVPFRQLIESFMQSVNEGQADDEAIAFASEYARVFEGRLFNEMNDLNNLLTDKAHEETRTVQIVNGIALLLAFILFFYIVLVALRRLVRSDAQLDEARRETTEIMDTIQEGLFLIDADLRIGTQQSNELSAILPVGDITGKGLDEIIKDMVNETDLTNTRRFVNQLFNKRVKENLLDDLNPLSQVKIAIKTNDAGLINRYLRFKFNRVYEDKQIVRVLVTVSDITEAVNLQEQLEYERRHNLEQTEMLIKVLHVDQDLLSGFIRRTSQVTQKVNQLLKSSGSSQSQLRNKLNDIFREVHSFKGEASALEFDSFVSIAEEAEEKLKELRNRPQLVGNDFMGVTVVLDRLIGLNEEIERTKNKLAEFSTTQPVDAKTIGSSIIHKMDKFAHQIAERQHKQVSLTTIGFEDAKGLSTQTSDLLRELITQLLRNAIVHGIETPNTRIAKGKSESGHITINFKHSGDRAELAVEDDGAGINLDALREKLRTDPRYKNKDISSMKEKELYRVLFLPGFTTAENSTEDAGRGEGMAIIRDRIQQLPQGKLAIQSITDSYTRFIIHFKLSDMEKE